MTESLQRALPAVRIDADMSQKKLLRTTCCFLLLAIATIAACLPRHSAAACLPAREQMRFGHSMGQRLEGKLELVAVGDRPVGCLFDVYDKSLGCWDIDPTTGAVARRAQVAPAVRREFGASEDRLTSSDGRHVAIVHRAPPSTITITDATTGAIERTFETNLPYQIEGLAYVGDSVFVARSFYGVGTLAPDGPTTVDGFRGDGTALGAFGTRFHAIDDHRIAAWDDGLAHIVIYDTATRQRTTSERHAGDAADAIELLPIPGAYLAYAWNRPFELDVLDPNTHAVRTTLELPACK